MSDRSDGKPRDKDSLVGVRLPVSEITDAMTEELLAEYQKLLAQGLSEAEIAAAMEKVLTKLGRGTT